MGIATTFAAIAVTSPFVEYHLATMATMVVGVISCVTMMANGINTLLSGNKVARFYLLAWSSLLISFIVLAFNKFGWLNTGFLAEYSVQVGSLAEVLLFSFALADRINQERNDRMKAQSLAIEQERIATLEQQRYLKLRHAKELEDLRAQQQLLTAEAESKAKTDFLANMSHEIRTPMNGVLGVAELLAQTPLNKEQRDYLNIISGSGKVLLNIINDILDFSKLNAGKMELDAIDFNLQEVCEQTISLSRSLLTSPEVDLYLLISENSKLDIHTDPSRLRQILLNLLSNAIKFTHAGSVTLSVNLRDDGLLLFEVVDTGVGISEDAMSKLFTPFTQEDSSTSRTYGGTGLGLSIAKRLVNLLGGEIGVESTKSRGSRFWFTLPCVAAHRKPAADILRTPAVLQEDSLVWLSHRLLVAEDNDVNQLVISRMLKKLGLSFDLVNNGARALDAVSSNPDKYDLILMDCEMPEMDGYEASLRIRQFEEDNRLKPLPILALTAHVLDSHREKVIEKGMNDHISKPVSLEMLKIKLEEYLPVAARLSDQSDLLVRGDPRL